MIGSVERRAEHRVDLVPGEAHDGAVLGKDAGTDVVVEVIEESTDVAGIKARGEGREPTEVNEEHGEVVPVAGRELFCEVALHELIRDPGRHVSGEEARDAMAVP